VEEVHHLVFNIANERTGSPLYKAPEMATAIEYTEKLPTMRLL
jgi:hypothetical protein